MASALGTKGSNGSAPSRAALVRSKRIAQAHAEGLILLSVDENIAKYQIRQKILACELPSRSAEKSVLCGLDALSGVLCLLSYHGQCR